MSLTPTLEMTPRDSFLYVASGHWARMIIHGVSFWTKQIARYCFDDQHAQDEVWFPGYTGADPSVDYSNWYNRRFVPHVDLEVDLSAFRANKELALVFGFDAIGESRVQIYSDAGILGDEILTVGDDQLLIEVESLDQRLDLYFIHSHPDGQPYSGSWFFRGITGYVI
jgi:hypothetical protein